MIDLAAGLGEAGFQGFCDPGTVICVGASRSIACGPDRTWSEEICVGAEACDGSTGRCEAVVCEAGERICDGTGGFRTCGADGRSLSAEVVPCPETEMCSDGACRQCLPGSLGCLSDGVVGRCAGDGSGWEPKSSCPLGTACHAPTATCVSTSCGQASACASPTTYRLCGEAGAFGAAAHPCGLGEVCLDGACVACAQGYTRCAGPGVLEVCDGAAGGYVGTPCPPLSPCSGVPAECRPATPPFCPAGLPDCVDAESWMLCGGDGVGFVDGVHVCAWGEVCSFGACVESADLGRMMIVVDRAPLPDGLWQELPGALWTALSAHPVLRFGLTFLPGGAGGGAPSYPQLALGRLNAATVLVSLFEAFAPDGSGPLVDLLDEVLENPDAFLEAAPTHLVLLLAGPPDCGAAALPACLEAIEERAALLRGAWGVTIHAIALGAGPDPAFLSALAGPSAGGGAAGGVHEAPDAEALSAVLAGIIAEAAPP